MASDKQAPHSSGRVVSVRIEEELIQRLGHVSKARG